jgi:hypothetical protein
LERWIIEVETMQLRCLPAAWTREEHGEGDQIET